MTSQCAEQDPSEHGDGLSVFIVDDDADMRQSLESLLRSLGYCVEAFASAQEFLVRAETGLSGCLLLDVRLPTISGLEVQRRLAAAKQLIPIIFLTGHGDIQMAVAAMKAGAVEFLPKPFREQQLIDAVAEAITRSEHSRKTVGLRNAYLEKIVTLSPREREILDDLASGLQIKEVANKRCLSSSTVRVHRRNIQSKIEGCSMSKFIIMHGNYSEQHQ